MWRVVRASIALLAGALTPARRCTSVHNFADCRRDARVGGRETRQRMAPQREERGSAERDQDQVTGVGRDARHRSHEDQDEGHRAARCDHDGLVDEGLHEAGLFGQPHADHRDEDDADRSEHPGKPRRSGTGPDR